MRPRGPPAPARPFSADTPVLTAKWEKSRITHRADGATRKGGFHSTSLLKWLLVGIITACSEAKEREVRYGNRTSVTDHSGVWTWLAIGTCAALLYCLCSAGFSVSPLCLPALVSVVSLFPSVRRVPRRVPSRLHAACRGEVGFRAFLGGGGGGGVRGGGSGGRGGDRWTAVIGSWGVATVCR